MTSRNGDDVSGTINWATLSTITKFRGVISGNTITLEEYEIIAGDEVGNITPITKQPLFLIKSAIEIPNKYTATLSADGTLEGTFVDSHSEEGKFKLSNTYHVPQPKDNFRTKSVW